MLKKLLKHEFIFLVKDFMRIYIIYGAVVLILKLLITVSGSQRIGSALFILTTMIATIYYIFTFVLALLTVSHNVRRFRKNLFSQEGYLTHTLPVTPAQHVIAKVIGGLSNFILSFLAIFLGAEILLLGIGEIELLRGIKELLDELHKYGLLLPLFLMFAAGFLAMLLFCYLITSVSSMVGGSKWLGALLAIGIIFAYIFISVALTVSFADHTVKSYLYTHAAFYAICAAAEFGIVIYIIKNKLNLQ